MEGMRLCGTPGCTKEDFHPGPCTNDEPKSRREHLPLPVNSRAPCKRKRSLVREEGGKHGGASTGAGASALGVMYVRPAAADAEPEADPRTALQVTLPSGLERFYHVHSWGVPLPKGPVEAVAGGGSDDEADVEWRLDESSRRTRARAEVGPVEAELMALWNEHVQAHPPTVSDRMLPALCRKFATAHRARLSSERLRQPFREHLLVLWEHNLLHRDDVHDCLLLAGTAASVSGLNPCRECGRPTHERHCELATRVRGAAAWPHRSSVGDPEDVAAAVLAGVAGSAVSHPLTEGPS
jgi:hypothetical protein